MENLYLYINLATILGPLFLSFDKHLQFYKSFKRLLYAYIIVSTIFIVWDVWYTAMGVWGFNPKYLSGIYLWNLPLGELLFFICVPYACIFLYRTITHHFPWVQLSLKWYRGLAVMMLFFGVFLLFAGWGKWYTASVGITQILLSIYLLTQKDLFHRQYLLIFLITLLPFLLVNGVLTGSFIEEQIVWYNDDENLGIRLFTIPIEDIAYAFALLYPMHLIYVGKRS